MAIAEMQKVHMAAHGSVADEILGKLQKLGCCQFVARGKENVNEADVEPLRAAQRRVEELLGESRFVSRFLEPFATEKFAGGMAMSMGGAPSMTLGALSEAASEESFAGLAKKYREYEKKLADAHTSLSRVSGLIGQLTPIKGLPYSLDFYSAGTEDLAGGLYSVPKENVAGMKARLTKALGDMADIHEMPAGEKDTSAIVSVICPRAKLAEAQEAMSGAQAARVDVPAGLSGLPADELVSLAKEQGEISSHISSVEAEISAGANEAYRKCQLFTDYWTLQKDKADALLDGDRTEQISLFTLWLPKSRLAEFKKIMEPYESMTDISFVEPEKGEKAPTLLENKGLAVPVEPLIEMYGTPTYGDIDPTALVAPFFYIFFGICFGDGGYGLLISALLMFLMVKKQMTGALKKFTQILIIGNVCALIFGALTFSWFGDSITAFSFLAPLQGLKKLQILDPMNDPMTMLYVSLAFGFVQIMVGLLVKMYMNIKAGDKFAAFADQGGWIIFLCGLVLIGLAGPLGLPQNVATAITAIGALILVFTQGREKSSIFGKAFSGIMSLYNVTGYLGDLLSYSRLLALGLGSAAVAMVINLLANMVAGDGGFGVVLGLLVFLLGHLFGIVVNILGAFVHSLRLQYVEFFGKFYESAGEEFRPLRMSTQFVKVTD